MIASKTLGKKFKNIVEYVNKEIKNHEVISKNIYGEDDNQITNEFTRVASMSSCKEPCYHLAISIDKHAKPLTKEQWEDVAKETLTKLGFINRKDKPDNQYYVVRHKDREHDHIHIIANRVGSDGKILNIRQDYVKIQEVMRKKEKELNLSAVKGFDFIEMEKKGKTIKIPEKTKEPKKKKLLDNGKLSDKDIIKDKIKNALEYVKKNSIQKDKSFDTYRAYLQDNGVTIQDTFEDIEQGKLVGMSYKITGSNEKTKDGKELKFSGKNVGYTLDELKQHLYIDIEITNKYRNEHANYVESKDKEYLEKKKNISIECDSIESFLEASKSLSVQIQIDKPPAPSIQDSRAKEAHRGQSQTTGFYGDSTKSAEHTKSNQSPFPKPMGNGYQFNESQRQIIEEARRKGEEQRLKEEIRNSRNYINTDDGPYRGR